MKLSQEEIINKAKIYTQLLIFDIDINHVDISLDWNLSTLEFISNLIQKKKIG